MSSRAIVSWEPAQTASPHAAEVTKALNLPAMTRVWLWLAVGSLVGAGLLSLAVVIGRLPVFAGRVDPLFFKRCLVVHVDLALLVWFYGFVAALAALRAPAAGGGAVRVGIALAAGGMVAMLAGALVPGAPPVLANYIPVIDHPLFLGGLAAFFGGLLLFLLVNIFSETEAGGRGLPEDAAQGVQAAAVAVVLAAATWVSAQAGLPRGLEPATHYEFSMWGAGHVLQVANVCAMLAVWLWLLARTTGSPVLTPRGARRFFILLLAPHFIMPLLSWRGSLDALYLNGATLLMRWGIFPLVLVLLVLSVRHLRRHPAANDPAARAARAGFAASAALTVLGFLLGAMIRDSTTLIPAHYHASLGAVTASFMAAAYLLVGHHERAGHFRSARRQLLLFGSGQAVFAIGFAIGGWFGLGRKSYGAEQHVRSAGELAGLAVMGVGGLVAAVAGLWFLKLILRELVRRPSPKPAIPTTNPTTNHERRETAFIETADG